LQGKAEEDWVKVYIVKKVQQGKGKREEKRMCSGKDGGGWVEGVAEKRRPKGKDIRDRER
jgi:hypothetical protein